MRTPSLLILMISQLFTGCPEGDPPIIPPPPATQCEYPAGNRNYSWRLDTVAWFPSTLGGIHAFSDSDAYLMGYIGEGKAPWRIFLGKHWNGTSWSTNINGTNAEIAHTSNDVTGDNIFMVSVGYWGDPGIKGALGEFDNQTKKWKGRQFQQAGELRSVWTDGKGYFIAVGDNGMVYIKDGYASSWVYQKAPTEFTIYVVKGIDKNEIYFWAYRHYVTGEDHRQIWKLRDNVWIKMFDTQDTTEQKLQLKKSDIPNTIGVSRCSITDSLKLYVVGWESYLFEGKGQSFSFKKTNLTDLGLPLRSNEREAGGIDIFTPNDIWIRGSRYNTYHWNGTDYYKMVIPGLPNDDIRSGSQKKIRMTQTKKIFYTAEVSSQVYVVIQGIPQ